jgi:hypothetical protein
MARAIRSLDAALIFAQHEALSVARHHGYIIRRAAKEWQL